MDSSSEERKAAQILIVEDSPSSLKLLTEILTGQGYEARPALGGVLAMKTVEIEIPDLILLDVKMPDIDGIEVCRRLKSDNRYRHIPVIFISALDETTEKIRGFNAGGVDYITKPFEPVEVLARVATHLRLHELNEQLEQKVDEATEELKMVNIQLQREIVWRKQTEAELNASLAEKEILLKEIHHRVKNNLQIISDLIDMQTELIADECALHQFRNFQDRIKTIGLTHEMLYRSSNFAYIDFSSYVQTLIKYLYDSHVTVPGLISPSVVADDITLSIDQAIPCALIINELVTNSLKHAFPGSTAGEINIHIRTGTDDQIVLTVADTGIGMESGLDHQHTGYRGLDLVALLTRQLQGKIELHKGKGTSFVVTFRKTRPEMKQRRLPRHASSA